MAKHKGARKVQAGPGAASPRPAGRLPARALHLVPESILTLATTAPHRPTVTIDGLAYRMAFPDDFALWQQLRLAKLTAQAAEIDDLAVEDEATEVTPEQWAELEVAQLEAYGAIVSIILPDIPEPTLLALTLPQRKAILRAFFDATSAREGRTPDATTDPEAGEATATPSPDGSAS